MTIHERYVKRTRGAEQFVVSIKGSDLNTLPYNHSFATETDATITAEAMNVAFDRGKAVRSMELKALLDEKI